MKYALLLIITLNSIISAAPEAGTYHRPSVTYLNGLLIRDSAVSISKQREKIIISELKETVNLPRFDKNWIPEGAGKRCFTRFSWSEEDLRHDEERYLREFSNCLEDEVVDPVIRELRRKREERAMNIRTDQQKNSFIHDKAKEPGYTIRELELAEQSAYIFTPMVDYFRDTLTIDTTIKITKQIFSDTLSVQKDTITLKQHSSRYQDLIDDPDVKLTYIPDNSPTNLPVDSSAKLPDRSEKYEKISYTIVHDTTIYRDTTIHENQRTSLGVGIVWWRLIPNDSIVILEQFEPITYSAHKTINARTRYTVDGKWVDPGTYSTWLIAQEAGDWFKHQIRDFEEFRLTTQITQRNGSRVGFSLNEEEIMVDDKFQLLKQVENDSGEIESKEFGWIIVKRVPGGRSGRTEYEAQSIGGEAHLGMVIREKPMGHGEISFMYQNYSMNSSNGTDPMLNGFSVDHVSGPRMEVSGNIGRKMKISQLFLVLGGAVTVADAHGKIVNNSGETVHSIYNSVGGHYDISLKKRFYLKRFSYGIQAGGGYEHRIYLLESQRDPVTDVIPSAKLKSGTALGFIQTNLGVAITPALSLETSLGYRWVDNGDLKYYSNDEGHDRTSADRTLSQGAQADGSGFSWSAGITIQPFVRLGRR